MSELKTDAEKAAEYAKTVAGDAVKDATTIEKDVQIVKTDVVAAEGKISAWIAANAGKLAIAVLVIAALVLWKLL